VSLDDYQHDEIDDDSEGYEEAYFDELMAEASGAPRSPLDFRAIPGTCRSCGCTEDDACPGGCIWANAEATLCSRCSREGG